MSPATQDPIPDAEPTANLDATTLLSQGIRSLALKKYDDACDQLARAVEALFVVPCPFSFSADLNEFVFGKQGGEVRGNGTRGGGRDAPLWEGVVGERDCAERCAGRRRRRRRRRRG